LPGSGDRNAGVAVDDDFEHGRNVGVEAD
jgi:hypothetical protein